MDNPEATWLSPFSQISHIAPIKYPIAILWGGGKQQQISTVSNYSQLICQLARRNICQIAKQGIILMKADQNRLQEIFPPIWQAISHLD